MISVEVRGRYDGTAYREDKKGNKFSREAKLPLEENELCKHGNIYKVEQIGDYNFKILSSREDKPNRTH